ncbi:hypothetical protein F2P44_32920 [Massilia sp. CCM 8695]|uniref:Uncharacterized protein n=1 Tax=Massilia frigida TaxID=2609281 RepID=A0ABX0NK83_9BURK|nr:hypothetical protein [Massilia frigida]NHZ84030.1 hypothetical protein [Massilia frigida]
MKIFTNHRLILAMLFFSSCISINGWSADAAKFDFVRKSPVDFLSFLQKNKHQKTYLIRESTTTWITEEHIPRLIALLEPLAKLAERMKIAWQRKRKGGGGRPFLA